MKYLILLISSLFIFTACDETATDDSKTNKITPFSKVKNQLFEYEVKSENKYLIIKEIDDLNDRIIIETYLLSPGSSRPTNNQEFIFLCSNTECKTTEVNNSYDQISLTNTEEVTEINIKTYILSDNDVWKVRSSDKYNVVE